MARPLPDICANGRHHFASPTHSAHGCGYNAGDHAADEMLVIGLGYNSKHTPQNGDVCTTCFQINGEPDGTRDGVLVNAFTVLASWD